MDRREFQISTPFTKPAATLILRMHVCKSVVFDGYIKSALALCVCFGRNVDDN